MPRSAPSRPRLKVLLICEGPACASLAAWLCENPALDVSTVERRSPAELCEHLAAGPDVVIKDLENISAQLPERLRNVRALAGNAYVIVLTFDPSPATRRRCHAAGADAVFHHTAQLDALAALLAELAATVAR